ncbi:class II histone deacetylase [Bacillus sp. Marseille-P3661]|uniref:class II histone deacetylase n=1 Tax=Bacillus sp. Marseille-P3661 TaxID=1936234 RepID=UPI000C819DC5|nr:class II histone deacetylase [Bacillus sp. Marseille-P3661]
MAKTGFICDESYFWHNVGTGALMLRAEGYLEPDIYAENPSTKRRIKNLLERSGFINELEVLKPRYATRNEIEYFHTPEYIDRVKELSDTTGGDAGVHAIVGKGTYEIAKLSVGGALTGIDAVMEGKVKNAYALIRPCGHHAEKDQGLGFCIFNNAVIAAHYAREKYGLKRIMIIDWDVHHGNGIEHAFYDDPNILFFSLHQHGTIPPGGGNAEDIGEGPGKGYNVNIPLPAGTGNAGYLYALENIVVPIADEFMPELVIVSAGQDPSIYDPLGRMQVTAEGFYKMASIVKGIADRHCNGRLVACHEGGYSSTYVPFCTLKVIECLSGLESGVEDPFQSIFNELPENKVSFDQSEAVDKVRKIQSEFWRVV